jgi:hypothetical protein
MRRGSRKYKNENEREKQKNRNPKERGGQRNSSSKLK